MFPRPPHLKYAEREVILRSLSQTCKDLRRMALPLLWKRIDMCWVPEDERGHWYKYVMQELKRKASGACRVQDDLRGRVEAVTAILTRSDVELALRAFRKFLVALPALHTIHILNCKVTKELGRALGKVQLPTVRVLVIPDGAAPLIRACPNVKRIRCVGGRGDSIIDALVDCQCEVFEGIVQWTGCCDEQLMQLKNAPNLKSLELRNRNSWPDETPRALRDLQGLHDLEELTMTFVNGPSDNLVALGRDAFQNSLYSGGRKLIVRWPASNKMDPYDDECEVDWQSTIETYN
ncbi:hypothetical protein EIP86_007210 [Pleurotus ostreatoroseus]|nr:hypothetical protein EIP86_007210 [Pleurotus ostreatoroseus]